MQDIIEEIKNDNLEEVKKLLTEEIEKDYYKGFNLLHWAALYNAPKIAKYLLSIGLDVDSRTNGIERILSHPNRNDTIIRNLITLHPEVKDFIGASPLIIACEKGHIEVAKILIKNNADVNYKDNDDNTPLTGLSLNYINNPLSTPGE